MQLLFHLEFAELLCCVFVLLNMCGRLLRPNAKMLEAIMFWFLLVLVLVLSIGITGRWNDSLQKTMLSAFAIMLLCLTVSVLLVGGVA